MEDILDLEPEQKKRGKLFSILASIFAIMTPLLFLLTYLSIPRTIKVNESIIPAVTAGYIKFCLISCFLGFMMSMISFFRKEKSTYFKSIGVSLNILWIILLISYITYGISIAF